VLQAQALLIATYSTSKVILPWEIDIKADIMKLALLRSAAEMAIYTEGRSCPVTDIGHKSRVRAFSNPTRKKRITPG